MKHMFYNLYAHLHFIPHFLLHFFKVPYKNHRPNPSLNSPFHNVPPSWFSFSFFFKNCFTFIVWIYLLNFVQGSSQAHQCDPQHFGVLFKMAFLTPNAPNILFSEVSPNALDNHNVLPKFFNMLFDFSQCSPMFFNIPKMHGSFKV